ncbi:hypothetical protein OG989_04265 [Micromonospora sp. NBC_01740]|uniref:hypothetical protein n=1 Tax=Micromonospora sp. NBC_01740 TaxID=2975986 RepID=UPI002E0F3139|nr:hypothetical protein OG989_04265 [Micromonospora sp. NBC_01740]
MTQSPDQAARLAERQNNTGELLATNKTQREIGHRWTVTGEHGQVSYDLLGNHLALLDPAGEVIDSMGRRHADEVRALADADDDQSVYELLAGHYRTELAGGAR